MPEPNHFADAFLYGFAWDQESAARRVREMYESQSRPREEPIKTDFGRSYGFNLNDPETRAAWDRLQAEMADRLRRLQEDEFFTQYFQSPPPAPSSFNTHPALKQLRKIAAVADDERGDPATRAVAQRKLEAGFAQHGLTRADL